MTKHFNVPNILTLFRILLVPPLAFALLIGPETMWIAFGIFIIAAITDFLDGHLARKYNQVSKFGARLDELADKLLVIVCLICIMRAGLVTMITWIPALVIIIREVFITLLRQRVLKQGKSLPVNKLGKWKTAIQLGAISLLLFFEAMNIKGWLSALPELAIWGAGILAGLSAWQYWTISQQKNH